MDGSGEGTMVVTETKYEVFRQPGRAMTARCGHAGCGTEIERSPGRACGDELGVRTEHGCGGVFCDGHLVVPPQAVTVAGGLCPGCLANLVWRGCSRCAGEELCQHDLAAASLADAIAVHRGSGGELPGTKDYKRAHELVTMVGMPPYRLESLATIGAGEDGEYRGGLVVNGRVIALRADGTPELIGDVGAGRSVTAA